MASLRKEPIPYENINRILGVELDDGTFLEQYTDYVQVDDGTPFQIEFFPRDTPTTVYDLYGDGDVTEMTPRLLQDLFDEGRAEVVTDEKLDRHR